MENLLGVMGDFMRVVTRMIKNMEMEFFNGIFYLFLMIKKGLMEGN